MYKTNAFKAASIIEYIYIQIIKKIVINLIIIKFTIEKGFLIYGKSNSIVLFAHLMCFS